MIYETLAAQKYGDLREMCDQLKKCNSVNKQFIPMSFYIKQLMKMPAPRFYVSAKHAAELVNAYYRGGKNASKILRGYRAKLMAEDLAECYERIRRSNQFEHCQNIWELVVNSPAKSFYLSEKMVTSILLYNYKKPKRNGKRRT